MKTHSLVLHCRTPVAEVRDCDIAVISGSRVLGDLAWPQVTKWAGTGTVLAVPIGATEQHGPHLSLSTDTDIAVALCQRLAERRGDVLVAPALPYGSSGEHAGFAGTISIGQDALETVILELGRSASETFDRVLLVCGHGGNADALTRVVARLREESRDVMLFLPHWQGEPHAGRTETSMMLALRPDAVDMTSAQAGDLRPIGELLPLMRAGGVRAVSETGVLGDPRAATATEGIQLLDSLATQLALEVAQWLNPASS